MRNDPLAASTGTHSEVCSTEATKNGVRANLPRPSGRYGPYAVASCGGHAGEGHTGEGHTGELAGDCTRQAQPDMKRADDVSAATRQTAMVTQQPNFR
jgi:hypothetical protein